MFDGYIYMGMGQATYYYHMTGVIYIHKLPNGPEPGLAFSHIFLCSICFYAMKTWELP